MSIFPNTEGITFTDGEPFSSYIVPVYDSFYGVRTKLGAVLIGFIRWGLYFNDLLPDEVKGLLVVLDSGKCGGYFTWRIDGKKAFFIGDGDHHEVKYENLGFSTYFGAYSNLLDVIEAGACVYRVTVYPSRTLEGEHSTSRPLIGAALVGCIFLLVVAAFLAFDFFQNQRNRQIVKTAAKTSAVVNSMFPAHFRDRLLLERLEETESGDGGKRSGKSKTIFASHNHFI